MGLFAWLTGIADDWLPMSLEDQAREANRQWAATLGEFYGKKVREAEMCRQVSGEEAPKVFDDLGSLTAYGREKLRTVLLEADDRKREIAKLRAEIKSCRTGWAHNTKVYTEALNNMEGRLCKIEAAWGPKRADMPMVGLGYVSKCPSCGCDLSPLWVSGKTRLICASGQITGAKHFLQTEVE